MNKSRGDIINAFKNRVTVTKQELEIYFRKGDVNATDESIRKRISRYRNLGILVAVKQGLYAITEKPVFKPNVDSFNQKIGKIFSQKYPEISYCTWSSNWLYSFTIHQPTHFFYLFETERDMVESTFNLFKDNGFKVFINPDEQTLQLYVMGQKNAIVVRPLVTRPPLKKMNKISLPSLEKMLVDAYVDSNLFYFIQGNELLNIFEQSISKYSIDYSRLLNYAKRRGKENEIKQFILSNVKQTNVNFLND